MHSLKVDKVILQMISFYYRIGFWHRGDKATAKELLLKSFYCVYLFLFFIGFAVAAITSEDTGAFVFMTEIAIVAFVLSFKLWVLIWKQKRILELLNRICVFSIRYEDDLTFVNRKLKQFANFVVAGSIVLCFGGVGEVLVPFFGSERTLFLEVAFPLDWKNDSLSYWIACAFLLTEIFLGIITCSFDVIMLYLMLNCFLRYQVLGSELRKMGQIGEVKKLKTSEKTRQKLYFEDLQAAIEAHLHVRELIRDLESFLSKVFLLLFGTSAMCICGSIYCLAFDVSNNVMEMWIYAAWLLFNISEIFTNTYFGNEIMLTSDSLSYCLFESNWIEQPQSTKYCVVIFGEYLKQPHTIIVGGLYPLTLGTFTKILNSAYSMLNILKNTKQ